MCFISAINCCLRNVTGKIKLTIPSIRLLASVSIIIAKITGLKRDKDYILLQIQLSVESNRAITLVLVLVLLWFEIGRVV